MFFRDNFSLHVEAGHNNSGSGDLPKELHCPLCLYHTKHKSNMIDHIVLHRGTHYWSWEVEVLQEWFEIFAVCFYKCQLCYCSNIHTE